MVIDIIIVILVLAGLAYGLRSGLTGVMAHVASIPVGLALVIRLSGPTAGWLDRWTPHVLSLILAWVGLSILMGLAIAGLLRVINAVLNRAGLQTANRLIGGWAGLVAVVAVLSLGQLTLSHIAPKRWNTLTDAHTSMRCLRAMAQEIEGRMPQNVLPHRSGE